MINIPITLTAGAFTADSSWTVEQFHQHLISSLTASVSDNTVLTGQYGGSEPTADIPGPWMKNKSTWYGWDGVSKYVPAVLKVGGNISPYYYVVTLGNETLTDNRTQTFQDRDGYVALLEDLYRDPRGTVTLSTGSTVIDWSLAKSFYLSAGTGPNAVTNINSQPGQRITIAIHNTSAISMTYTNSGINWQSNGVAPIDPTINQTNIIVLENISGGIYGTYTLNHH